MDRRHLLVNQNLLVLSSDTFAVWCTSCSATVCLAHMRIYPYRWRYVSRLSRPTHYRIKYPTPQECRVHGYGDWEGEAYCAPMCYPSMCGAYNECKMKPYTAECTGPGCPSEIPYCAPKNGDPCHDQECGTHQVKQSLSCRYTVVS